nr:NAD(+)/NADH kinase [uncultured Cetobacterium sp.]
MKGTIIYNKNKKEAVELNKKYSQFFLSKGIDIVPETDIKSVNFVVVIGGDGTLLRASKTIIKNPDVHVFAVNAGSLGFLTEIKSDEFEITFENYLKGYFKVEERAFLKLKYGQEEADILNEVVISKKNAISRILNLKVYSGKKYLCTYKADGVIVATPTGSTAYSLSAGGPIVMPGLKATVVTPLAPHNLTTRPIILDGNEKLKISLDSDQNGCVIVDGEIKKEDFSYGENIEIFYSDKKLKLISPEGRDYYGILRDKLKWGDNLC